MNELATASSAEIAMLDDLARDAQYYARSATNNLLQLGRVLCDAKNLVKHGEWENWVNENAGCSLRSAQQIMQAYTRFGGNQGISSIAESSKMFALLALPEGTEDEFLEHNDVATMTSRETKEAVRKVREEMGLTIAKEREAREAAEARAEALANRPPMIPDDIADELREKDAMIQRQSQELSRVAEQGKNAMNEAVSLRTENVKLKRDIEDRDAILEEVQQDYGRVQQELLDMRSAAAKGDAERVPMDELTLDVFAGAVRQFVGICARMPHMRHTFGAMSAEDINAYDELLRTIEGWAAGARAAMSTITIEEDSYAH